MQIAPLIMPGRWSSASVKRASACLYNRQQIRIYQTLLRFERIASAQSSFWTDSIWHHLITLSKWYDFNVYLQYVWGRKYWIANLNKIKYIHLSIQWFSIFNNRNCIKNIKQYKLFIQNYREIYLFITREFVARITLYF